MSTFKYRHSPDTSLHCVVLYSQLHLQRQLSELHHQRSELQHQRSELRWQPTLRPQHMQLMLVHAYA